MVIESTEKPREKVKKRKLQTLFQFIANKSRQRAETRRRQSKKMFQLMGGVCECLGVRISKICGKTKKRDREKNPSTDGLRCSRLERSFSKIATSEMIPQDEETIF
jgi:hypothetical protein